MSPVIEISDKKPSGALAFDLAELLAALPAKAKKLTWAVLELNATGHSSGSINIPDLEDRIARSPTGIVLTWDQLRALASELAQVNDGIFAAYRNPKDAPTLENNSALYDRSDIVLEAIDSSLWRIFAKDEIALHGFRASFKSVQDVDEL